MERKLLDARQLARSASRAPLLVADVPWLLYRSFFALPRSITGADGAPVNALLGTVNALLAAEQALAPTGGCAGSSRAWERRRRATACALYPPYHAHREPMPQELRAQWNQARALLESFGWTYATSEELEADDVMFSYACAEQERSGSAMLLSGDRDMFGAVSEHVSVLELARALRSQRRSAPRRCASATASSLRRCPTSSRCEATPPTGCRARRASARRPLLRCCRRTGRSSALLELARNERSARSTRAAPAHARSAPRQRAGAAGLQADRNAAADRGRAAC